MSDLSQLEVRDAELISQVIDTLKHDSGLAQLLGDPPRIFDEETQAALFPYVTLERHEREDTSVSTMVCARHRFHFASWTRDGGRAHAKLILSTLRIGLQRMDLNLIGQRVTLVHPTYSDVLRTRDPRILRGQLRVRIHTEEI